MDIEVSEEPVQSREPFRRDLGFVGNLRRDRRWRKDQRRLRRIAKKAPSTLHTLHYERKRIAAGIVGSDAMMRHLDGVQDRIRELDQFPYAWVDQRRELLEAATNWRGEIATNQIRLEERLWFCDKVAEEIGDPVTDLTPLTLTIG